MTLKAVGMRLIDRPFVGFGRRCLGIRYHTSHAVS
jgi:hypothetical protein